MNTQRTLLVMLADERCVACRRDSPRLTPAEADALMAEAPGWELVRDGEVPKLRREFRFRNFVEALSFTNAIGAAAEAENHHPAILTEWGKVTCEIWTHAIGGLHRNDFILAAKISELAR